MNRSALFRRALLLSVACVAASAVSVRADDSPQGTAGNATRLQGRPVSSTAPTTSQTLTWNGSAWAPATPSGGGGVTNLQTAYDGGRTILTASAGTPVAITGAGSGSALTVVSGTISSPDAGSGSERFGASSATGSAANSTALGNAATVSADYGTAVGQGSTAPNSGGAFGFNASAGSTRGTALGYSSTGGTNATAVGASATATGTYAVAVGYNTSAAHQDAVALGTGATTTATNQLVAGGPADAITDVVIGNGVTSGTPTATVTIRTTGGTGAADAGAGLTLATGVSGDNSTASGAINFAVAVVSSATAVTTVARIDPTYGQLIVGGNLAASSGKVAVFRGDVKITGAMDPTSLVLADDAGGTALFIDSGSGATAPVSGATTGRLRWISTGWGASSAGGAYAALALNGGNTLGAALTLGTNDAQDLALETSGTTRLTMTTTTLTSTLPATLPVGATTACSVNFTSDPNTGVYSPGADQVALVTGGTARFTLSTTVMTTTLPLRGQDGSVTAPALSFSGDTNTGVYRVGADQLATTVGGVQAQAWTSTGTQIAGIVTWAVSGTALATDTTADVLGGTLIDKLIVPSPDNRALEYQFRPTGSSRSYSPTLGVGVVGASVFVYSFSEAEASDAALGIHAGSTAVTLQTMALSTVIPLTLSHYDNAGAGTTTDYLILDPADVSLTLGVSGGKMGFFGLATPISKPTVTGSRGGNAALADLLQELQALGLITDSSS